MTTIPASEIVRVIPNVLNAGGSALALNGLMLTTNDRVPTGTVQSFASASAVADFFGDGTDEATNATKYFLGFDNSDVKPGALLIAQYNDADVSAYIRGGSVAGMSLAALKALSGPLAIVVDGANRDGGTVNLSAATSFSSAAGIIETALNASEPTEATATGSFGAAISAAFAGTTLTVSAVSAGVLHVGDTVSGSGVTSGTKITALGSGSGGTGTYTVDNSQTVGSESMTTTSSIMDITALGSGSVSPGQTVTGSGVTAETVILSQISGTTGGAGQYQTSQSQNVASESFTMTSTPLVVSYDSQSGGFIITSGITGTPSSVAYATGSLATSLKLTLATGAVLSQGAAASVPGTFMDAVTGITQNWASFFTIFDPDDGDGNTVKQAFSNWTNDQDERYAYVAWDNDESPTVTVPATGSLGYYLQHGDVDGTIAIWAPDSTKAAFISGTIASINFAATNGRTTLAFRSQAGLIADVTDQQISENLIANGYNFYGAYATANQGFVFLYNGQISGRFDWADSYVNEIWLNNAFQLALMELLVNVKSIPYNDSGYALIEQALADPIQAGLAFGAFRTGVPLSSAQAAEVNQDAGTNIAPTLAQQGWYLQVQAPTAQVRAARGTPQIKFWYMDGEAVQKLEMDSIAVQ
jgi:hypothetical protein